MRKKITKIINGPTSSVMVYEDGTKENLPDGVFASFNTEDQTKDQPKDGDANNDLMKAYKKQKKGEM